MKCKSIYIILASLLVTCLNAKPIERLILIDGSYLEGHVSSQSVANNTIEFIAEKSVLYLDEEAIHEQSKDIVSLNSVDNEWKEWGIENPSYISTQENDSCIELQSFRISIDDLSSANSRHFFVDSLASIYKNYTCKIIEQGFAIKCVSLSPRRTYEIPMNYIEAIEKLPFDNSISSGLIDVIETINDTIKGQITYQKLGDYLKIKMNDGSYKNIRYSSIVNHKIIRKNQGQDIFSQSQYLDKIKTNKKTYTGLIIEKTYSKNKVFLQSNIKNNSLIDTINLEDIQVLERVENKQYSPVKYDIIQEDEVMINDIHQIWLDNKQLGNDQNMQITLANTDSCLNVPNYFVLKMKKQYNKSSIAVLRVKNISKKSKQIYQIQMADIFRNQIQPISTEYDKERHIMTNEYKLSPGFYAFIRTEDQKCIIVQVTNNL